jgi:hypothetical protein
MSHGILTYLGEMALNEHFRSGAYVGKAKAVIAAIAFNDHPCLSHMIIHELENKDDGQARKVRKGVPRQGYGIV